MLKYVTILIGLIVLSACESAIHQSTTQAISKSDSSYPLDLTRTYYTSDDSQEVDTTKPIKIKTEKHCYYHKEEPAGQAIYLVLEKIFDDIYIASVSGGCFEKGVKEEHSIYFARIIRSNIYEIHREDNSSNPHAFNKWAHNLSIAEKKLYKIETTLGTKVNTTTNKLEEHIFVKVGSSFAYKSYYATNIGAFKTSQYPLIVSK